MKNKSIENLSVLNSSEDISLDATFASKLAHVFCNLGTEEMLKTVKREARF